MTNGNERMTAAAATATAEEFLVELHVLAVDDAAVCLKVLEALLRQCGRKYHVTTAMDGEAALRVLRAGKNKFDLVISDVHMSGMDGFTLLSIIKREMDIPVILLSADEEEASVAKGMAIGACDYLVKPVSIKELKNIWKHVVRRRIINPMMMQPIEISKVAAKSTEKKCSRKRICEEDNVDENKQSSTKKTPRVTWTSDLHRRFLRAINQIGIDKAVPKKILEVMKVSYITRESVASHLQKYRKNLKNILDGKNEHGSSYSSSNRMNSLSHFVSISNDAEAEDDDDELPKSYPGKSYADILRNKLLETSKGIPGDSLEDMPSTAATMSVPMPVNKLPTQSAALSVPVNPIRVQSPQLCDQHSIRMNCTLTGTASYSQDMARNCSTSWQTVVPTEFAGVAPPFGQIPVFQDQTTAIINNAPAPMAVLGETMLPYDNTMNMVDGNFAARATSSSNPTLALGLEIDSLLAPTPMLNDEGYSNQAPDGQINDNDDILAGTDGENLGAKLDELFASEGFAEFMDKDWL